MRPRVSVLNLYGFSISRGLARGLIRAIFGQEIPRKPTLSKTGKKGISGGKTTLPMAMTTSIRR